VEECAQSKRLLIAVLAAIAAGFLSVLFISIHRGDAWRREQESDRA